MQWKIGNARAFHAWDCISAKARCRSLNTRSEGLSWNSHGRKALIGSVQNEGAASIEELPAVMPAPRASNSSLDSIHGLYGRGWLLNAAPSELKVHDEPIPRSIGWKPGAPSSLRPNFLRGLLGHLQMLLERRQSLAGEGFDFRVVAFLCLRVKIFHVVLVIFQHC